MRIQSIALTATAIGALLLVGAAPANAAGNQIDPGDSLYALNCDDNVYNDWQLLGVDASTAASVLIGDGTGGVDEDLDACAGQGAYDVTTGTSYYIQWYSDDEDNRQYGLATIDVATGESVTIGEFFVDTPEDPGVPLDRRDRHRDRWSRVRPRRGEPLQPRPRHR